jgi:hypothetical protein
MGILDFTIPRWLCIMHYRHRSYVVVVTRCILLLSADAYAMQLCTSLVKILLYSCGYLDAIKAAIHDSREVICECSSLGLPIAAE